MSLHHRPSVLTCMRATNISNIYWDLKIRSGPSNCSTLPYIPRLQTDSHEIVFCYHSPQYINLQMTFKIFIELISNTGLVMTPYQQLGCQPCQYLFGYIFRISILCRIQYFHNPVYKTSLKKPSVNSVLLPYSTSPNMLIVIIKLYLKIIKYNIPIVTYP